MPDLFCRMLDGQVVVTDCRPVSRADEKFRRKAAVTAAACSQIGWDYRLVGEPDPVWAANLRWLAGYRHPRFGDEHLEEAARRSLRRRAAAAVPRGRRVIPSASGRCCSTCCGAAA